MFIRIIKLKRQIPDFENYNRIKIKTKQTNSRFES